MNKLKYHIKMIFLAATNEVFFCKIVDDWDGIDPEICSTFFLRRFPSQKQSEDIERKRGEGTLMAYQEWELNGGSASITNREDGYKGTVVELQIPCFYSDIP